MQCTFIINGTAQLILIPENELDKLLLEKTIESGVSIEVEKISQPTSILGKPVMNSYILRRKLHSSQTSLYSKNDPSQT